MKAKSLLVSLLLFGSFLSLPAQAGPKMRRMAFSFKAPTSGVPSYTIGGAVRGELCAIDRNTEKDLMVYVDSNAATTKSHPTIVADLPEFDAAKTAYLVVKDAEEDYYQEQAFTVPQAGGRVAVTLDETKPGLAIGEDYQFYLRLQCGSMATIEDPVISGKISRVADTVELPHSASLKDRIMAYAKAGYWYDTLALALDLQDLGDSSYFEALVGNLID